ncbi:MAG: 4'-phosphopantetheinyl transferase superfamily protein [Candidatus Gastranaerophilales bacterium]|nr:4'-phosphopantetheinyl transferase superfamily protein [Candidatus Gastranaerophilales bacterium]
MIRIYLLNVRELTEDCPEGPLFAESMKKVDETRQRKAEKMKTAAGKAACLGAGLLLQKAVRDWERKEDFDIENIWECLECTVQKLLTESQEVYPLTYRYGQNGKPYFAEIPLYFSLSHSGDYVLSAISEREIGVDIQKIRDLRVERLADQLLAQEGPQPALSAQEELQQAALAQEESAHKDVRSFFRLWVQKEAWGKLTGQGVFRVLEERPDHSRLYWRQIAVPEGYVAALCGYRDE